ncbi:SH3 and multiple ankyrin repeat domains protein 2 [Galemys pyrenaicus]|uniref:SH3 and multiple ankyrin repeat domains protein 2 n=1 Tax=Galemys pyrenaicus TaxID=202257 RepID=A0A8J6DYF6_GALPY|nr:SH3 and multiple ankyrin repeat domains protein 2 [Galemys pyrenaicus]
MACPALRGSRHCPDARRCRPGPSRASTQGSGRPPAVREGYVMSRRLPEQGKMKSLLNAFTKKEGRPRSPASRAGSQGAPATAVSLRPATPSEACQCHLCPGEAGQCHLFPSEIGQCRLCPDEACQCHLCPSEIGQCRLCPSEIGQCHLCPGEACQCHLCPGEACQCHLCPGEIGQCHLCPSEAGQCRLCPGEACQCHLFPSEIGQCHLFSSEIGQCRLCPSEAGQCRLCPSEACQCRLCPGEACQCHLCPGEIGQCHLFPSEIGQCHLCPSEIGQCRFCPGEIGQCHLFSSEIGQCHLCPSEIGQCRFCPGEIGQCHLFSSEIGQCRLCPGEACQCHLCPGEACQCHLCPGEIGQCHLCPSEAGQCRLCPGEACQCHLSSNECPSLHCVLPVPALSPVPYASTISPCALPEPPLPHELCHAACAGLVAGSESGSGGAAVLGLCGGPAAASDPGPPGSVASTRPGGSSGDTESASQLPSPESGPALPAVCLCRRPGARCGPRPWSRWPLPGAASGPIPAPPPGEDVSIPGCAARGGRGPRSPWRCPRSESRGGQPRGESQGRSSPALCREPAGARLAPRSAAGRAGGAGGAGVQARPPPGEPGPRADPPTDGGWTRPPVPFREAPAYSNRRRRPPNTLAAPRVLPRSNSDNNLSSGAPDWAVHPAAAHRSLSPQLPQQMPGQADGAAKTLGSYAPGPRSRSPSLNRLGGAGEDGRRPPQPWHVGPLAAPPRRSALGPDARAAAQPGVRVCKLGHGLSPERRARLWGPGGSCGPLAARLEPEALGLGPPVHLTAA